jgi:hydroxyethylthiazole kinase-like uncharacterized protein yjeF
MKVSRVSEMRDMDKAAIDQFGITEDLLMENAGLAAYAIVSHKIGVTKKKFLILCGVGNNGGDGFVVARHIHSNGGLAQVNILGDPSRFTGAAKRHLEIISRLSIEVQRVESVTSITSDIAQCDAIVDAIFGTGLTREVTGLHRDVITSINASGKTVLSLDIPSGVHGDTGQIMGTAVQADYTVTFGLPKIGNMLYPGYELCGDLSVSHISFPPSLHQAEALKLEINQPLSLPPRARTAHKGTIGQALFIAGASSYFGAPYFAACSFLKAGGGYSRLAAPASMIPFLANKGSEIVFVTQQETPAGSISFENRRALVELSERMDMVILGPGLSLEEEAQQLARILARDIDKPLLVDGDGITALCQDLEIIKQRRAETILTPHLGEMSRITTMGVREIDANKIDILQRTSQELQAMIILKGAHTLIGHPDQRIWINMSGNPGMATAGSGDVLTGTIAAMFGLGLSVLDAARMGVFVHGLAGDLASEDHGEDGMTAQDILDYLPQAVKSVRRGIPDILRRRYAGVGVV